MTSSDPNKVIEQLINDWCSRRELRALSDLLPAWLANNGLTDGWHELRNALRTTLANGRDSLPEAEQAALRDAERAIDERLGR